MQNSSTGKAILLLAGLIVLIGVALHFIGRTPAPAPANGRPKTVLADAPAVPPPEPSRARHHVVAVEETPAETNLDELVDSMGRPRLSRAKVEEYLALHQRSAPSLLAAFHAMEDTNYLREAAATYPNDPAVQWTIVTRDVFPDDRRQWLDAFKASSPSNSLADYFSARDYLTNGRTNEAIAELVAATRKGQFKDYAAESRSGEEELRLFAGQSSEEAIYANGWATDLMPQLASFKGLAQSTAAVQNQYRDAGDAASASQVSEIGLVMAGRLNTGDGGHFVISELVGNAMESIALAQMDQNAPSDLLGGKTPAQRLDELKQRRAELKQLSASLQAALMAMTPAQRLEYSQRMNRDGETVAMRWLQQQAQK